MDFLRPSTKPGWRAAWFVLAFVAMMIAGPLVAGISSRGGTSPRATVFLTVVAIATATCILGGLAAAITALRHKDRSAPVWVAMAFGVLSLLFLVGELTTPH